MKTILTTTEFNEWFESQPEKTQGIIEGRFELILKNHWGDHKRFDGLIELRWKNGNRVYAFESANMVIIMLYGGNKNGQSKDINKAKKIRDEVAQSLCSIF